MKGVLFGTGSHMTILSHADADRLDPLSTKDKMSQVEKKQAVERNMMCYTLRGVMEICRLLMVVQFWIPPQIEGLVRTTVNLTEVRIVSGQT